MEGYDLRAVLAEVIDLRRLLNAKLGALNLEAEPYFSVTKLREDELTAIKEEKLECGVKAKLLAPTEISRHQAKVVEFATEAQGHALIRTSQLVLDRHINPHYLESQQVIVETHCVARISSPWFFLPD